MCVLKRFCLAVVFENPGSMQGHVSGHCNHLSANLDIPVAKKHVRYLRGDIDTRLNHSGKLSLYYRNILDVPCGTCRELPVMIP